MVREGAVQQAVPESALILTAQPSPVGRRLETDNQLIGDRLKEAVLESRRHAHRAASTATAAGVGRGGLGVAVSSDARVSSPSIIAVRSRAELSSSDRR